jgi:hypothetical protein
MADINDLNIVDNFLKANDLTLEEAVEFFRKKFETLSE